MNKDKLLFVLSKEVARAEKELKKAIAAEEWGRAAEVEAYMNGLRFADAVASIPAADAAKVTSRITEEKKE